MPTGDCLPLVVVIRHSREWRNFSHEAAKYKVVEQQIGGKRGGGWWPPKPTIKVTFMPTVVKGQRTWYAPRAVQFHPHGGQSDFVWLPARTPHGAHVWRARRN